MTAEDLKNSIKAGVEEAIKSGKAKMRPKAYFIARTTLLIVGSVFLALLLIYLISFIFFVLRATGVWFVPAFGAPAFFPFMAALPWLLILLALIFIIVLEWAVRHYSLAWRKPLLYSAVGIVIFVVASGFVVAQTPLHRGAYRQAQDNKLPLVGPMYRGIKPNIDHQIHLGTVIELVEEGFLLELHSGDILNVKVSRQTRLPLGSDYTAGDEVVVMGDLLEDLILDARGVREIEEDLEFMHRGKGPGMRLPKPLLPKP